MDQQSDGKKTVISGIIAVAVLVLLVGGVVALKAKQNNKDVASSKLTASDGSNNGTLSDSSTSTDTGTSSSTSSASSTYKNGTYTATGSYTTPESHEQITVTVTLRNDDVSNVSVSARPTTSETSEYQQIFIDNYRGLVVGKDIDSVSLSRVSGSSLTSRGFNDAIEQIKDQAKS